MLKELITSLFKPVTDILAKREDRKIARETADAKLKMAKADAEYKLELSDQEWEALSVQGQGGTWKDEYVTVSIVSVFNLIVLGGIFAAFGEIELLHGIGIAITALGDAGVDVGFLLEATVLAAIGLKVWRA